jgi:hypothetical protein
MPALAPESAQKAIANAVVKNLSGVEKPIGNVQDNPISLFLSKTPDEKVKEYIDLSISTGDLPNNPDISNELEKHINVNYTKYTITPNLKKYESLYVHNTLITEGKINLEEANTLLGCHKIDTQDKLTVTMSESTSCSVMGGRKSRKQRRSKRRRRRGRQSRK